jgi:hypothetical protein
MEKYNDYILCYAANGFAYFTNVELDKQWGDDWDDAPYEHNAGSPYNTDSDILKVAHDGWFEEPCTKHLNSPYSVEIINKSKVPWLRDYHYDELNFYPGDTFAHFINQMRAYDMEVYLPISIISK